MKKIFLLSILILLNLSCEKEVSTSPEEDLITNYKLYIDSDPRGSKIYIDNRNSGQRTPDTIGWLEKGNHLITLKTELLKDSNYIVTISEEMDSIYFNFRANPTMYGNLYLDTNPDGAEIYLNDSNTTFRTPRLMRGLFPQEYKITYKLPGYWDANTSGVVVSERTVTIYEKLVDTTIWINYTNRNVGLPTDQYNDVAIQDGYIKWFASEGSGLIRFDEKEWTIYNTENSNIPSNYIKSVRVRSGGLWIGTDKGAAHFINGNFIVYNSSNSPLPDKIKCVYPSGTGKAWIGTVDEGLFYFDGINWTHYNKSNSPLATDRILSLCVDNNNIIWIGTLGGGLYIFDGTNWNNVFNSLPSPRVEAVLVTESEVWTGCSFHTFMFWNGITFEVKYLPGGLGLKKDQWEIFEEAGDQVVALAKDSNGKLWFSDYSSGLYTKSDAGFVKVNLYNFINGIAIDANGDKWITTATKGIIKYKLD